jgi:glycosyltransferase involved in cell wall biosynthesis
MELPDHPQIKHLGELKDDDKNAALNHCEYVIMPSFQESLSIVILEAWLLERPVLVNGHCKVLKGQARRANGGLWYTSYGEFREVNEYMLDHPDTCRQLAAAGHRYVTDNYSWQTVTTKVRRLLGRVLSS